MKFIEISGQYVVPSQVVSVIPWEPHDELQGHYIELTNGRSIFTSLRDISDVVDLLDGFRSYDLLLQEQADREAAVETPQDAPYSPQDKVQGAPVESPQDAVFNNPDDGWNDLDDECGPDCALCYADEVRGW